MKYYALFLLSLLHLGWQCSPPKEELPDTPQNYPVKLWTTSPDAVNLLYAKSLPFATAKDDRFPTIEIDSARAFQTVEGFGYTLTGGSAYLLRKMDAATRTKWLNELFGADDDDIKVSYLRISLGASDLDAEVFSYDDLPAGQTDPDLTHFNLSKDTIDLIPVLKEILAIRPGLRLMASPWSAPVWMKTNNSSVGGNLKTQYYSTYAQYFVKYLKAMAAQGIIIDAVTVQNEPQHGGNNPSMVMSSAQQGDFVKNHLGPAFQSAGLNTKIIIWDHNCDNPNFPLDILNDAAAKPFVFGTAFHLYGGDISALSQVHNAHPDKALYFTEQWTGSTGNFGDDLRWHVKNVVIGSMRNHSRVALEWNLANDPNYQPHTPGGCSQCKGALTINGSDASRNVSYYIIAHASRFVPPGSVRLWSTEFTQCSNVAFRTPEGKIAVIVQNESNQSQSFNIRYGNKWMVATLLGGNAGTFVF